MGPAVQSSWDLTAQTRLIRMSFGYNMSDTHQHKPLMHEGHVCVLDRQEQHGLELLHGVSDIAVYSHQAVPLLPLVSSSACHSAQCPLLLCLSHLLTT